MQRFSLLSGFRRDANVGHAARSSRRTQADVILGELLGALGPAADAVAYAGSTITFVLTGVRE